MRHNQQLLSEPGLDALPAAGSQSRLLAAQAGGSAEGAILNSLPLGLFVLDSQGRLTYLNLIAERFFQGVAGRTREQLLGKSLREACPEVADSVFVREYERAAAEHRDFESEVYYPTLSRWFLIRGRQIQGGWTFVLEDVTHRVLLQRTAHQQAAELAEAEGSQHEFLGRLACRLRSALVPLQSALRLRGEVRNEAGRPAEGGEQQVADIAQLADDLLRVSQGPASQVRPGRERFYLAQVVARALDSVERHGRRVNVAFPAEPLEILGDPKSLAEVIARLLNNAVRFTSPGGRIEVSAAREGNTVELSVRDNGIGISPEELPRIFNHFQRRHTAGSQSQGGGLGLGLMLVKVLVEQMGGRVEARSEGSGRGSEFLVRLPAAPPEVPGRPTEIAGR